MKRAPDSIRRISLWRLAVHDFGRAISVWRQIEKPETLLQALVSERSKALGAALKSLSFALLGSFWLISNKSALELKISLVDISIPAAYVNFFASLSVLGSIIQFASYFMLDSLVGKTSRKLLRFDSPWLLTIPLDGSSAWSLPVVSKFHFFKSNISHLMAGLSTLFLLFLPLSIIFYLIYSTIFSVSLQIMSAYSLSSAYSIIALVSLIMIASTILYPILVLVPFGFTKNRTFVRWIFLIRVHRRMGSSPSRTAEWLADARREEK